MRALIRLGRAHPTPVLSIGLAAATLLAVAAGTRSPVSPTALSDNRQRITVNSPVGALGGAPGKTTLPDALALAASDPSDNIIQFNLSLSPTAQVIVRPGNPLVLEGTAGGHDTIDGGSVPAGVILDLDACPDAGIVIGGGRQLTLANLTLRGGGRRAILLKDAARLTLRQVTVRESRGPGLAAFGQAGLAAARCRFVNNKTHAIELHGNSTATIDTSNLEANGQSGLAGFDQSAFTVTGCKLDANREWNVVLTHASQLELTSCLLRRGAFAGIDLSESARALCRECVIEEGGRFGLFATGSACAELIKTRLRNNRGRGIELQEQARLALGESVIEQNGEYGLILFGRSGVLATGSLFAANGAHGASLRGPSTGDFTGCSFTRNRYGGVGCLDAGQGGRVRVSQCVFHRNGMRPIYRGPLHIDPLVPTPLAVNRRIVECLADPNATIELYLDHVGEAGKYLRTLRADRRGRFQVNCAEVPDGFVMTATATRDESTSEFNVIAGAPSEAILGALLGRTGPYSDDGGEANLESVVRRWKPGTKVVLQMQRAPSAAVERYVRFLVARIGDWTHGAVKAEARIGSQGAGGGPGCVVVPVRYVSADSPQLLGLGGVTFMRWDAQGYFQAPMEILLALGGDPEETCPRVLAHEVGHALGLSHTRVGLLSRMQGKNAPARGFLNDFSPTFTYYDVLALQMLHDPRNKGSLTWREIMARGEQPARAPGAIAEARSAGAATGQPTYSPPPRPATPDPQSTPRR